MGDALLMKLSNDVEKYEIEVTKMGQKYIFSYSVLYLYTAQNLQGLFSSYKRHENETS